MTLEPGAKLGPYQIVGPIGAGGMGEVFRAKDTRLLRDVAVKVLPESFAADPERRARFEQEARAASALNHPNIITLLDIGDTDGVAFMAMEYVEGKTLRELVASGPLPSRKVLEIAEQLADGLAKAHGAGILHRDLKPDNVMVSKDGFVKILDFGLAKLEGAAVEGGSELETAPRPGTSPGAVMGTVGYMSPEQASGRPVDFRSDQFSLGTILYEMVTGTRPFVRKTNAETLVAIIREEPEDAAKLNPRSPAPLRWLIERCLEKDPEDRFSSTLDLARDLGSLRQHLSESSISEDVRGELPRRRRALHPAAWAALGLATGLGVGAVLWSRASPPGAAAEFRRLTFRSGTIHSARFAPDGQTVVYSASWEGQPPEIFTVRLDGPESRSLGLPSADMLSVSRSGELAICLGRRLQLGFEGYGTLARVPLGGGSPREVLENVADADWAPDDTLAVARNTGRHRRLEFPIGKVLYESSGWISHVRVAPDGRRVLFIDHAFRGDNVGAASVTDGVGPPRVLARFAREVGWAPNGDGIWLDGGRFVDLEGRTRDALSAPGGTSLYDVSRDGRQLLGRGSWRREVVGLGPGQEAERGLSWLDWSHPDDLSSDGRTLLFDEQNQVDRNENYTIYTRATDGSPPVRLGKGASIGFSPDGRWALATDSESRLLLLPTGAGEPRPLDNRGLRVQWADWFPDGKRLLVTGSEPGRGNRLYVLDLGGGNHRAVSPEGVVAWGRGIAPDGRQAVGSGPDGTPWLYPIDGGEARAVPGCTPEDLPIRWTGDGRSLYLQRGSAMPARVDVVDVATGARRLWKELRPPDPTGVHAIGPILLTADGSAYAYSYRRLLDDLYLAEGLR
ncbi:MAG TPA: protein kinase [Vicinamibacteria bacterium]|nr:protein kinase [Vicinamibacteria bacterium]